MDSVKKQVFQQNETPGGGLYHPMNMNNEQKNTWVKQNTDTSKVNKREKAGSKLVKTHGDTTIFLELEKEFLHKVAFFVQPPINIPWISVVRFRRNAEVSAVIGDVFPKLPLAICPVRQYP